ncbi:MAG: tRNA-dihydrouridine synthase [Patescibacteria group bacterium]
MNKKGTSKNFWTSLPRPFFVLAPMANVTDAAFRSVIAKYGKPDVTWTEFVSADGLMSAGRDKLLVDLRFTKAERPIVAQLFTGHPEAMRGAASLVAELGFDGLDINMGCPDRAVEKQGGGAGMIKTPEMAVAVIRAAQEGVRQGQGKKVTGKKKKEQGEAQGIPVTVKTRIGYNKVDMKWLEMLILLKLPALTVHLRTRKEMSDVPAHWELMPEIVALRDRLQADIPAEGRTLIIGNGDVMSVEEARVKVAASGCDGVMIGRGIFGTPWLFRDVVIPVKTGIQDHATNSNNILDPHFRGDDIVTGLSKIPTPQERLRVLLEHTLLFEKKFKGIKNFAVMKKHFKAYVSGWEGAKELRAHLMETNSAKEVKKILKIHLLSM